MELAMVHDPWRQGGYNADSDFSAPSSGSETQDKRCYKFKSRDKGRWWYCGGGMRLCDGMSASAKSGMEATTRCAFRGR